MGSVFRHAWIDLIAPHQNPALHVARVLEAGPLQNAAGFRAAEVLDRATNYLTHPEYLRGNAEHALGDH